VKFTVEWYDVDGQVVSLTDLVEAALGMSPGDFLTDGVS
jgi:hypothetical protein